jgi:hypothetical protein
MAVRKIYCEVVEGAVYEDRCIFKMSQTVEGNKTCERCILRELEDVKKSLSDGKQVKKKKRNRGLRRKCLDTTILSQKEQAPSPRNNKRGPVQRKKEFPKDSARESTSLVLDIRQLSELTGKARRTLQEWAQQGKIPAKKTEKGWEFSKIEIEEWLSGKDISTGADKNPSSPKAENLRVEGTEQEGSEKDSEVSNTDDLEGSSMNGLPKNGVTPKGISEEKTEALSLSDQTQNDPEVTK